MSVTIGDVADRAGVSTATVSRVLSGSVKARAATRERVLIAVRELGYRPSGVARSLKLQRTQTMGVIISDVENPYFAEMVRGIEDVARELDYALLLCNGAEDPEREAAYLELLVERRVDGIVIATSGVGKRHARWLGQAPVPVVMVNSETPVPGVPTILSDNREGGRLAGGLLVRLGHRQLGHLSAPAAHAAAAPRLAGLRDALKAAGLGGDCLAIAEGDGHVAGGERAMFELLEAAPDVTGVVCYNDLTAIGALRALRARGRRVPADVSVIGFDNLDLSAYVDPPLTTIVQQKQAMARWAVERLVRIIKAGPRSPDEAAAHGSDKVVRLPVALLERESTGPAPGGILNPNTKGRRP
jgi:LacI family transcriptional regulator